jgi:hypothetical protein
LKILITKRAGGVAQGEGPEFKPQYHTHTQKLRVFSWGVDYPGGPNIITGVLVRRMQEGQKKGETEMERFEVATLLTLTMEEGDMSQETQVTSGGWKRPKPDSSRICIEGSPAHALVLAY